MSAELLPCPFCGSDKLVLRLPTCRPETPYHPRDRLHPLVDCLTCSATVYGKDEDYKGTSAIAAWNRRAVPQTCVTRPER